MWLEKLSITNFRSCKSNEVRLSEDLTLLVGENDGGKSNIIDALRLATNPASDRPTLWLDEERDLTYQAPQASKIELQLTYTHLTPDQDAAFIPSIVDAHGKLVHTTSFLTDEGIPRRSRISHSVGEDKLPDPEPESRGRIAHVYLPPLRDAAKALGSADSRQLAQLFLLVATEKERDAFLKFGNSSLKDLANKDAAKTVKKSVQSHLDSLTRPIRQRFIDLQPRDQSLRKLVSALRMHMAAEGIAPADLLVSGLGHANLLYISTVVLQLEKAKDFDLLLLLVEEPEAHLHPQYQSVLLNYLKEKAEESSRRPPERGLLEGRIQVIATSHSPHLASSVSTNNVVAVRIKQSEGTLVAHERPTGMDDTRPVLTETSCVSLREIEFSPLARRKLDRYLDATRSELLFARQVVLVEGIAESLLLRAIAEHVLFPRSDDSDPDKGELNRNSREQFRAVSVSPIDGVDFMPYLQILFGGDLPLVDKAVVVTDGDDGLGDARKRAIEEKFHNDVAAGRLIVQVGGTTLEAELYAAATNEGLMRDAFAAQHPKSLQKWDQVRPSPPSGARERALAFSAALKKKTLDIGKGDFAHVISELVATEAGAESFVVPEYIRKSIVAALIPEPMGHINAL